METPIGTLRFIIDGIECFPSFTPLPTKKRQFSVDDSCNVNLI